MLCPKNVARKFFLRQLRAASVYGTSLKWYLRLSSATPQLPELEEQNPHLGDSLLHIHDLRRCHPEREVKLKVVK